MGIEVSRRANDRRLVTLMCKLYMYNSMIQKTTTHGTPGLFALFKRLKEIKGWRRPSVAEMKVQEGARAGWATLEPLQY